MVQVLKTAKSNLKSNASSFGKTVMGIIEAGEVSKSGPFIIIQEHGTGPGSELYRLLREVTTIRTKAAGDDSKGDSVRETNLDFFYQSGPDGAKFRREFENLKELGKTRTRDESKQFESMQKRLTAINMLLVNTIDCYRGICVLQDDMRLVVIETRKGSKELVAKVRTQKEMDPQYFGIGQIKEIGKLKSIVGKPTADLLKLARAASNKKQNTPNAEAGNGDKIEPSKIGDAAVALDTTMSSHVGKDGTIDGVSPAARDKLHALWAKLDAMMSDADKSKARAAYAALAAKPEPVKATPAIVVTPPAVAQPAPSKRKAS